MKATPKTGSPIAAEALAGIAQLYAIEKEIHGCQSARKTAPLSACNFDPSAGRGDQGLSRRN